MNNLIKKILIALIVVAGLSACGNRSASLSVPDSEKTDLSKSQTSKSGLVEPLSEREIEVLQLIAEGLSNQEIGSRLFLSLNTVKAHNRNIYAKLDVNNRTQAVTRSRALGILLSN